MKLSHLGLSEKAHKYSVPGKSCIRAPNTTSKHLLDSLVDLLQASFPMKQLCRLVCQNNLRGTRFVQRTITHHARRYTDCVVSFVHLLQNA